MSFLISGNIPMKKWIYVLLMFLPTCVVAVPNKPYDIINQIVQNARDEEVVAYGTHNDVLIKTPKDNILRVIYAQKHDSDFWSHYTVPQMGDADALNDNCFINFQYDFDTEYRLFCGTVTDYKSEHPTVSIHKPAQKSVSE